MLIEIDQENVKTKIFECASLYQKFADVLSADSVVLMSVDKYTDLDMSSKNKLKWMIYADIIISMKNLGHTYQLLDYESAPLNFVVYNLDFPNIDYGEFLQDSVCRNHVRRVYEILINSSYVGEGKLSDLNLPIILKHTPNYDMIDNYYKMLFLISKYTSIVDRRIDMDEFVGLYNYSKYIDIDNI